MTSDIQTKESFSSLFFRLRVVFLGILVPGTTCVMKVEGIVHLPPASSVPGNSRTCVMKVERGVCHLSQRSIPLIVEINITDLKI
jgi:hypothetical protein